MYDDSSNSQNLNSDSNKYDGRLYSSSNEIFYQDIDSFVKYMSNLLEQSENNINNSYGNIKNILTKLETDYPDIDIQYFSEFLTILEEFYNLTQNSKVVLQKTEELNQENEKYKSKIDKINGKRIELKTAFENLKEEVKFKDSLILKLQDDLNNISKEYMEYTNEMLQKKVEKTHELNQEKYGASPIRKGSSFHSNEYRQLYEEKVQLMKENSQLLRKIETLEKEIKIKYIPKFETEKKIIQIESEKNTYSSKLKICEINLEKTKKQLNTYKFSNDDLRLELDKANKKVEELISKINEYTTRDSYATEIPLNFVFGQDEDEDTPSSRNRITKLSRMAKKPSKYNYEEDKKLDTQTEENYTNEKDGPIVIITEEKEPSSSDTSKEQDKVKMLSIESENTPKNETKNKFEITITSEDIVNRMSNNQFIEINKLNENKLGNNLESAKRKEVRPKQSFSVKPVDCIQKNTNLVNDVYKDFFLMTYQSVKLNSECVEPFLILSAERLYKATIDNHIPFHKFYNFIYDEVKKYNRQVNRTKIYNENKYETVLNFISSRLF